MKKLFNKIFRKKEQNSGYYDTDVWCLVGDKYKIKDKLWDIVKDMGEEEFGSGIVLFGEIIGPGIQGQHYTYGLKELKLELFDIVLDGHYVNYDAFHGLILMLDLPVVEELHYGYWCKEIQDQCLLNHYIDNTKTPHEGVVVKCISGDRSRVSKVINPDYLIFGEKNNVEDGH